MGISVVPTSNSDVPTNTGALLERIIDPFGVYCVLEVAVSPVDSLFHVFPVMPESLEVSQRYLQTITPTQGGVFVDEYGRAPSPIVLAGTFGRSPRVNIALGQDAVLKNYGQLREMGLGGNLSDFVEIPDVGLPAQTDGASLDRLPPVIEPPKPPMPTTGYRMMKLLGEMVELSHRVNKDTGYVPVCRFYNFAFGAFYEVVLNGFDASMTVNRNGLWNYRLQMTAIRRLNEDGSGIDSLSIKRPASAEAIFKALNDDRVAAIKRQQEALGSKLPAPVNLSPAKELERIKDGTKRLQRIFDAVNATVRTIDRINGLVTAPSALDIIGYGAAFLDRKLGLDAGTLGTFINNVRNIPRLVNAVENIVYQVTKRLPAEFRELLTTTRRQAETVSRQITPILQGLPDEPPARLRPPVPVIPTYDREQIPSAFGGAGPLSPPPSAPMTLDLASAEIMEMAINVEDVCDSIESLLYTYGAWDIPSLNTTSVLGRGPGGQQSNTSVAIDEGSSLLSRQYIIRQNDTLASIARLVYGDEDAWPRIAQANRLLFGDALASGDAYNEIGPSDYLDLYIGRAITLPSDGTLGGSLVPYVWDDPIGARALGTDLPDSLQTITRADGTKDLAILSPLETLLQGCLHRLRVPLGAIGDDETFGSQLPGLIGQNFGALDDAMNAAKAEMALRAEPRLVSVNNVTVVRSQDRLGIMFQATARNAGSLGAVNVSLSRQSP